MGNVFTEAFYKARGKDYMEARVRAFGRPDMGSRLSNYGKREETPFSYWTVRSVDGLFQDWDARHNLAQLLEGLGFPDNVTEPSYNGFSHKWEDYPGAWFDSWEEEFGIAVQFAHHIEANDELREWLRAWEHADTDARRAEAKEKLTKILAIATGGIAAMGAAILVSATSNEDEAQEERREEAQRIEEDSSALISGALAVGASVVIIGALIWLG